MNEINFSFTYSESIGIDEKFNSFVNILNKCYDESFPIKAKKLGAKRIQNPWLTPALLNSINQKHKLYRNFKNKIIPFQVYNAYDKQLKAVLKKAKRKHYSNKFQDCNKDSKATWGLINKLINNNKKNSQCIKELNLNNQLTTNQNKIADGLNEYFVNVGKQILRDKPPCQTSYETFLPDYESHFSFIPITVPEVKKVIAGLKNKKCDVHSIPNHILNSLPT